MTKQVVKGKETKAKKVTTEQTEDKILYLKFPDDVNVIQINRMSKPIFIPENGLLEVNANDRALLDFCYSIEGVMDITKNIESFRK